MNIAQLRALILLGNVAAAGGLVVAGGGILWRLILPPRPAKVVEIGKPKVDVKRREPKPPRDTFKAIWNTPIVPDMQPSDKPVSTETPIGPTNFSVEQAENLLKQNFELRMTHPNWERTEHSWASLLVKGTSKPEEILVQPDSTPKGQQFRVVSIHDDYVLFRVRDVEARLGFPGSEISWEQQTAQADAAIGASPASMAGGDPNRATGEEPFVAKAKKVSAVLWHVSKDEAKFVSENYNRILREVGVAPHRGADGKIDGIELTDVADTSLVAKRGFQAQDVIKSVNGELVNDPRTLPEILRRQQGKDVIAVVYSRRGVDREVTYRVK